MFYISTEALYFIYSTNNVIKTEALNLRLYNTHVNCPIILRIWAIYFFDQSLVGQRVPVLPNCLVSLFSWALSSYAMLACSGV